MDLSHIYKIIGHLMFQNSYHPESMIIIYLINPSTNQLVNDNNINEIRCRERRPGPFHRSAQLPPVPAKRFRSHPKPPGYQSRYFP